MPFKSKKQSNACFASNGFGRKIDCKEWAHETNYKNLKKQLGGQDDYMWGNPSLPGQKPPTPTNPYIQQMLDISQQTGYQETHDGGQLNNSRSFQEPSRRDIKVDPFFLLRGVQNGLSWLGGIKDRARQNQYMMQQYSTLGQAVPANLEDYQPTNNNQYFQMGGPRLVERVPDGYLPIPGMTDYFKKDTNRSGSQTPKVKGPQMSDGDWRNFIANNPQRSAMHSSDTVFMRRPTPAAPQQHPITSFDGEMIYGMDNKPAGMYRFNTRSGMFPEPGITNLTGQWADAQWMDVDGMGKPTGEMVTIPGQDFFNRVIEGGNRLHNRAPVDSSFRALSLAKKEMGGMKKGGKMKCGYGGKTKYRGE